MIIDRNILRQTTLTPKKQDYWYKKFGKKKLTENEWFAFLNDMENSLAEAETEAFDLTSELKDLNKKRESLMSSANGILKKAINKQEVLGKKKMEAFKDELRCIEKDAEKFAAELSKKSDAQKIARIKKKF